MNRDELLNSLKDNILEVTFTKINGDTRIMTCTLHESLIPVPNKEDHLSQKKVREISEKVINVWDTSANGWRSFRLENIINVNVVECLKQ